MAEHFMLLINDGIAHLQFDRPESGNPMPAPLFLRLRDALRELHASPSVQVLLISATGPSFSAGLSAEGLAPADRRASRRGGDRRDPHADAQREAIGALMQRLEAVPPSARHGVNEALRARDESFDAIEQARFPVVCAIQGGCSGSGVDLAAACDLRVCSSDAYFELNEQALGVSADLDTLQRLARLLPQGVLREMAFAGQRLGALRAAELGFVNAVLPDTESLLAHALGLAQAIAGTPSALLAARKLALNQVRPGTALQALTLAHPAAA